MEPHDSATIRILFSDQNFFLSIMYMHNSYSFCDSNYISRITVHVSCVFSSLVEHYFQSLQYHYSPPYDSVNVSICELHISEHSSGLSYSNKPLMQHSIAVGRMNYLMKNSGNTFKFILCLPDSKIPAGYLHYIQELHYYIHSTNIKTKLQTK